MNLQAPQIIYIIITALGTGISLAQHGKPKKGNESAWATIIAQALSFALLYWGGFFS
jgi:hypothetical protein